MRHQQRIRTEQRQTPRISGRPKVVIADDGIRPEVVILDTAHPIASGAHFVHRGRDWKIRGRRHGSRVLFAEPVGASRQ